VPHGLILFLLPVSIDPCEGGFGQALDEAPCLFRDGRSVRDSLGQHDSTISTFESKNDFFDPTTASHGEQPPLPEAWLDSEKIEATSGILARPPLHFGHFSPR
jgi:hypothetical protein